MIGSLTKLTRFAGDAGKKVLPALRETMRMSPDSKLIEDIAANFGIDAAFGVLQGVMTPGDLREKLIAGTSATIGGGLGGLTAASVLPKGMKQKQIFRQPVEIAGGFTGDMLGQMVGDQAQRLTSSDGKTAYERLADEQRRQVEQQALAAYGIGGYQPLDLMNYG